MDQDHEQKSPGPAEAGEIAVSNLVINEANQHQNRLKTDKSVKSYYNQSSAVMSRVESQQMQPPSSIKKTTNQSSQQQLPFRSGMRANDSNPLLPAAAVDVSKISRKANSKSRSQNNRLRSGRGRVTSQNSNNSGNIERSYLKTLFKNYNVQTNQHVKQN